MSEQIDFPIFDADHHLYETEDCFTRYLPEDLRVSAATSS